MGIAILTICAFVGGAACVFFYFHTNKVLFQREQSRLNDQIQQHASRVEQLNNAMQLLHNQQHELEKERSIFGAEHAEFSKRQTELQSRIEDVQKQSAIYRDLKQSKMVFELEKSKIIDQVQQHASRVEQLNNAARKIRSMQQELDKDRSTFNSRVEEFNKRHAELQTRIEEFHKHKVTYKDLQQENATLKIDVKNLALQRAKQDFENRSIVQRQDLISAKSNVLARKHLNETQKWIEESLTQHNYAASKQRLTDAITWCREIGVAIPVMEEQELQRKLKAEYELVVRAAFEKEEQARIRAQIREEQEHEREVQRAIDEAEREKRAVEAALIKLRAEADGKHTEEIKKLEAQLAEAIAKSQRAISQAQLTKAGNVYIISNIGSLGDGVFKIGMTRRLEPLDRVRELSSASVPFPYDVHMMIATDNAPALENALHRAFHKQRVNKTNPRKEFFRVTLQEIIDVVKKEHGEVIYTADAEALQYRQSLNMKDEDQLFIETVFDKYESEKDAFVDEE